MNLFLLLAFLFFIGCTFGWVLEVFFRRFLSASNKEKKWINPGFLNGPYLPLYGFGLCLLYLLSEIDLGFIGNQVLQKILLFVLMGLAMTLIELIAGIIFIRIMKVKLWDYSHMWGNIGGLICPLFSLFWTVLSVVYYFFVHPYAENAVRWLSGHIAFSFVIGMFFGVFLVDFCVSVNLLSKIRRFANDNGLVVFYEQLKLDIRRAQIKRMARRHFLFSFVSDSPLAESLRAYLEKNPLLHREKYDDDAVTSVNDTTASEEKNKNS